MNRELYKIGISNNAYRKTSQRERGFKRKVVFL